MDQKKLTRYLVIYALFIIILIILNVRANKIEKGYQFSGIVQEITIGDKDTPEVKIEGKVYFLTYTKKIFNDKIKPGDSLIKNRNSRIYKLVKYATKEVIVSK